MKEQKTLIMISVRAPSFMETEKMEAISKKIFTEVVVPFKCKTRVHNSRSKYNKRILVFYIFKDGRLKNSVQRKGLKDSRETEKRYQNRIEYLEKKIERAIDVLNGELVYPED